MFTFALDCFAGHGYFSLHFQPLSTKRKEEEGIWKTAFTTKPLITTVSGVECQIDRFACFVAYFSSFPKENTFQSLENFRTINGKTEFPDFSLTDFP